jgi:hypothetical protein
MKSRITWLKPLVLLTYRYCYHRAFIFLYAIYIIAIAGAESAIGLGILVAFYRFISSLISHCLSCGKKKTYSLPYVPSVSYGTRAVRNYSTKQSKNYSTNQSKNYSSDPWFITGLFDGEGSFVITILKNSRYKTGWIGLRPSPS